MPVYIREYKELARERYGGPGVCIPAGKEPALGQQTKIDASGVSQQSAVFDSETTFVLVTTDEICHITFGTNPTATTNDHRMPADSTQFFGVERSGGLKLAVIAGT